MNSVLALQLLLHVSTTSCASSITVSPQFNYTTFVSNISTVAFNCTGAGSVLFWIVDGNAHYTQPVLQRGVRTLFLTAASGYVSSRLVIPTTAINNNTEVVCKVSDVTLTLSQYSPPQYLKLQGPLDAPYNFSVATSNTSNTTILFSWGAPFSLHVTDYQLDIFYYTLCCNISIYGCRTISSDPDCTYPRTCTSSINSYNDSSGTEGRLINTFKNGIPIQFTLVAVNGAGNGDLAIVYFVSAEVVATNVAVPQVVSTSTILKTSTTIATKVISLTPIGPPVSMSNFSEMTSKLIFACVLPGAAVTVCAMITGVACLCVHCRKKLKVAENPSYNATNKMAHCNIENMEPCPAYAQIHMHVYDDIRS